MTINENWAVSSERIAEFFDEQTDVLFCGGVYKYSDCTITLTPVTGNTGTIPVLRTQVCFEGPEEQVTAIYKRFFLRFLSAGG